MDRIERARHDEQVHKIRATYSALFAPYKKYIWFLPLIFLIILFRSTFIAIFVVALLVAAGCLSTAWRRIIEFNFGFELVTFASIVLAWAYNPIVGLVAALFMLFVSSIISGTLGATTFGRAGAYLAIFVLAFALSGLDVGLGGMVLVVTFNVLLLFIYAFTYGFSPIGLVPVAVNIVLNFIFLTMYGQALVGLLRQVSG